ncbi:MAG: hypothetical protein ACLFS2_12350 [Halochromatium sp.]|uniref:hypothetical protein n=1 Tax=Halochromatium sp. TaxID=2049430 RepID=UPI00397C7E0E
MHIEAIYDKGRLEFKTPLRLKRDTLTVIVEVPDEAIETAPQDDPCERLPPEVIARAKAMREALDAIRDAPPPPDDELPALSDKQRQRLDAFALREDR